MIDSIKPGEWRRFLLAAVACFVIYVAVDVIPMITAITSGEYTTNVIDKATAEAYAAAFAEKETGLEVKSVKAVHQSNKLLTGYLSKEELLKDYSEQYDSKFPTDTYQAEVKFNQGGLGYVYLHMENGQIAAWNFIIGGQGLSDADKAAAAVDFLAGQGFRAEELQGGQMSDGLWSVQPAGYRIKEAQLEVDVNVLSINDSIVIAKYKPVFTAPDSYVQYVKKQDSIASALTGIGYFLMSIILFILAVIYAVLYRKFTSFKFGIVLTLVFLVTYLIMNLNVMDGIRASLGESDMTDETVLITAVFTVLLTIPMAGSIYISLVAGDGLWKAQGRNLWPRFGQPGYGEYVWRSMGLSYLFTIILFAMQAVIFLGLKFIIGTWDTSDVTQSPFNMKVLWLMPVLAWAAAISEEAVFRFFGIGLFRKWFKNTFAAALLPTLFWALGHVMYPFYPSTTRLIELMIIGLVFSFIFVRYGLITAMFTHAIFNSAAVGLSLLTIGSAPNIISAIFFTALPVPIAFVIRYLSRKKEKRPPFTATTPPHLEQQ